MATFDLHPRLAADTVAVCDLALCRVLLTDDVRFPWTILVPRRPDLREIADLPAPERGLLIEEVAAVSQALRDLTGAEKLNVGAIGNLVPQLHLHVVARFAADAAWPAPVWGFGERRPYAPAAARNLAARIAAALPLHLAGAGR